MRHIFLLGVYCVATCCALGLSACARGAAIPIPTSRPTASPTMTSTPTPSPSPTLTGSPTSTATPTPLPSVQIEIVTQSPNHILIAPGQSATVAGDQIGLSSGSAEISVLVHYPTALGTTSSGGFAPYPVNIAVTPPDWTVETGNRPQPNVLSFRLRGANPGTLGVTIDQGAAVPKVAFTLLITPPSTPTPLPATPTRAPTATPKPPSQVTLADDGKTITVHPGNTFLLALGTSYNWTVNVGDPAVVSRVPNVTVVRGAQGIYRANLPGQTALVAIGDPTCLQSRPACAQPSRVFKVTVIVQ